LVFLPTLVLGVRIFLPGLVASGRAPEDIEAAAPGEIGVMLLG
jgi:hypothetical protein